MGSQQLLQYWPRLRFAAHPRSGLYARRIDVPGLDTKFIEARKVLLGELLDLVLPAHAIEHSAIGAHQFELRYGLAAKPVLVRFRVLDPTLAIAGLTDLTVRVSEFAKLDIAASRVFIVENEVTGLAFPELAGSLLIFGGGYGIYRLATAQWLCSRTVVYWGDIDTHGFAILDRLRALLPQTNSLLMDRETLLAHRAQWSSEATPQTAELHGLDPAERALYDDIRFDRLGFRRPDGAGAHPVQLHALGHKHLPVASNWSEFASDRSHIRYCVTCRRDPRTEAP